MRNGPPIETGRSPFRRGNFRDHLGHNEHTAFVRSGALDRRSTARVALRALNVVAVIFARSNVDRTIYGGTRRASVGCVVSQTLAVAATPSLAIKPLPTGCRSRCVWSPAFRDLAAAARVACRSDIASSRQETKVAQMFLDVPELSPPETL